MVFSFLASREARAQVGSLFGAARSNSGSQIGRDSDPVNDQATTLDLLRRA